MRCALSYDKETDFSQQKVNAWGEMQSLEEEPCYREDEIESETDRAFFHGFKCGIDEALHDIDMLIEDGELEEDKREDFLELFAGELAMQLFSILDHQEE